MMTEEQEPIKGLRRLKAYRNSAERLLGDLNDAIDDMAFLSQNGRILHALDFTEIYAFVLPSAQPSGVDFLPKLTEAQRIALDLAILKGLFFGSSRSDSPPPIVLLPPYRVELRNSESVFQHATLNQFRDLVAKALVEVEKLHL